MHSGIVSIILCQAPDVACQVNELQELLKAKGLDTKVSSDAFGSLLLSMILSIFQQGSKAVLVSRLVAAAAAAPAAADAAAPAPAPTAPSAAPAAAPAAAVPTNQSTTPSASVNISATAADDEAARLQKRMEKFGTVASAPAAAVSDAEAERIKKRGAFLLCQQVPALS